MWENRAIYFTELNRLGANISWPILIEFYKWSDKIKADQVVCPPALRPAMIILIAMLAAPGISNFCEMFIPINRGYEDVTERLKTNLVPK